MKNMLFLLYSLMSIFIAYANDEIDVDETTETDSNPDWVTGERSISLNVRVYLNNASIEVNTNTFCDDVTIILFDNENNIVYKSSDYTLGTTHFFNISSILENGNYTLKIIIGDRVWTGSFIY